jgi:tetratricopeptide (TPR) repeat protein
MRKRKMKSIRFILGLLTLAALAATAADSGRAQSSRPEVTEEFHQTYPLSATGRVALSNINGSVRITAWDRNEVKVDAVKRAYTQERLREAQIKVDANSGSIEIETEYPDYRWNDRDGERHENPASVDYTLTVPRSARVEEVSLINGGLNIEGVSGPVHASSVNGRVAARGLSGPVNLSVVNGRLEATLDSLGSAGTVNLSAVNGALVVTIPSDSNATVHADTVHGPISNDFGLPVREGEYVGRELAGRLGAGGARVSLNNVNGSIQLKRAADGRTPSAVTNLLSETRDRGDFDNDNDNDNDDDDTARDAAREARDAAREAERDRRDAQREAERERRDALREAERIFEARLGAGHPRLVAVHNTLGSVLLQLGDFPAARQAYAAAGAIVEARFPSDSLALAKQQSNLAMLELRQGHLAPALAGYQDVHRRLEQAVPDHPETYQALYMVGAIQLEQSKFDDALATMQRVLAFRQSHLGDGNVATADVLDGIANVYQARDDYPHAIDARKRSLAIREKALGPDNPDVVLSLDALAFIALDTGDCAQASALAHRALDILDRAHSADHLKINALDTLGSCAQHAGRLAEARATLEQALGYAEVQGNGRVQQRADLRADLAEVLWKAGERAAARKRIEEAAEIYERAGNQHGVAEQRKWLAKHRL